MFKRIIWIILDSVGAGELPDCEDFGDMGADTLGHIYKNDPGFCLPNMQALGLGNIDGLDAIPANENPIGIYAKAMEKSNGKDTTVGHWEMAGIYTKERFPTYPDGFPDEIIKPFIENSKIPGILCNGVDSGTEVLKKYGQLHIETKKPIVYTSADSVFQIACHEGVYAPEELYCICREARKVLTGKHQVARVIARPFVGEEGSFVRTENRRDFSILPPKGHLLDLLTEHKIPVYAVGKISDIFCNRGITESVHTKDNMDGVDQTLRLMKTVSTGLIFTNLVEFDSKWGHRRDVEGYATGLKEFDKRLEEIIHRLDENDLLIINSDHGCDPTFKGTDHTREYIPVLFYGNKAVQNLNLHIMETFADIGQTIADNFNLKIEMGKSHLEEIWNSNII